MNTAKNNLIACDMGLKRIGLAHILNGIILPLPAITRKNKTQALSELENLLTQRQAKILVVGMPHLCGVQTQSALNSAFEAGELSENEAIRQTQLRIWHCIKALDFSGDIYFINEDYSSKQSEDKLAHLGRKNRQSAQKDGRVDSLSACEILQNFLNASVIDRH